MSVELALSPVDFRTAMGAFATGVTVVTVRSSDDVLHGMTVNSFSSVSLDPMLVLVCLNATSRGVQLIADAGVFGVNVLSSTQEALSRWFASRARPADSSMFDGVDIQSGATGCPVLPDASASFDCRVHRLHDGGDHVIAVGEVVALRHRADREPLLFHAGSYRSLTEPAPQIRAA